MNSLVLNLNKIRVLHFQLNQSSGSFSCCFLIVEQTNPITSGVAKLNCLYFRRLFFKSSTHCITKLYNQKTKQRTSRHSKKLKHYISTSLYFQRTNKKVTPLALRAEPYSSATDLLALFIQAFAPLLSVFQWCCPGSLWFLTALSHQLDCGQWLALCQVFQTAVSLMSE